MNEVTFEGIASGDWECFCWAVDLETYVRVRGCKPNKYDKNGFYKGLYSLYPSDALGLSCYEEVKTKRLFTVRSEDVPAKKTSKKAVSRRRSKA